MKDKLKGQTAFMAFSAAGYPALFLGCYCSASDVRQAYEKRFGHTLKAGGYSVSRVRIEPVRKAGKDE